MGRLSCSLIYYKLHLLCCYISIVSGLLSVLTRLTISLNQYHRFMGAIYVIAMSGVVYTSVFIHSFGLPLVSIAQYSISILAIIIGNVLIRKWEMNLNVQATEMVQQDIQNKGYPDGRTLTGLIKQKRISLLRNSTIMAKLTSYKSIHGWLFVLSWVNLLPKLFMQSEFTCSTYSVFKPHYLASLKDKSSFESGQFKNYNLTLVSEGDPDYSNKPWANREILWVCMSIIIPSMIYSLTGFAMMMYNRPKKEKGVAEISASQ